MRRSILLLVLGAAFPVTASGSPPVGPNSTMPACISLVGSTLSVPATAFGQFHVVVRDITNNPISGVVVTVDLSQCTDLHMCADQLDPGLTLLCGLKQVGRVTDATGTAEFTLLGGSNGAGNATGYALNGRVLVNGTLLGYMTVSAYDLDGSGGVGANDLSAWLGDFGTGLGYGRSDFDCSGGIGANDLSLWLNAWGSGTMAVSCAASCP